MRLCECRLHQLVLRTRMKSAAASSGRSNGAILGYDNTAYQEPGLYQVEFETKVHSKVRNHGEGPY